MIYLAKLYVQRRLWQMNIILLVGSIMQFAWITMHILFLQVTLIFHKSIVVQHSVFLYSWCWHIVQHTAHTECTVTFPLQQCLLELATMLHVHCISCYVLVYTWLHYIKWGFLHCDCLLYPVCTESCQQMKIPVADGKTC